MRTAANCFERGIRVWVNVSPNPDDGNSGTPGACKRRSRLEFLRLGFSPKPTRLPQVRARHYPAPSLPSPNPPGRINWALKLGSNFWSRCFKRRPDGLSIADNEQCVLWASDQFVRMFGYAAAEVIGQPLERLVVPPERLAESQWVNQALQKGERITLETQRRKKDGSLLDVSVSCAPLLLDGKIAGFYAGYHDISDRTRVEALSSALYRIAEKSSSAHDLQQFFTAVHSIVDELMYARNFYIALYDPATELVSFPYFVDEYDSAPSAEEDGKGIDRLPHSHGRASAGHARSARSHGGSGEVARNGSRSLDWMGVPLKVGHHTFGALVVQTYSKDTRYGERDKEILTFVARQLASAVEIKHNEQALRRSEARYRSLVQSSVYGIYRSSLEGRFLDVNPALISMLGYGRAEEVLLLDPEKDVFANPEEHDTPDRRIPPHWASGRDRSQMETQRCQRDHRSDQRTGGQQRRRTGRCPRSHC